jgi:hypothetical protein
MPSISSEIGMLEAVGFSRLKEWVGWDTILTAEKINFERLIIFSEQCGSL